MTGSLLLRRVRLVPVAAPAPDGPLDLRITDGTISELASRLAARAGDEVIDAAGRWAMPGLWDAHVHLRTWAETRRRLDVSGTDGPAAVTARVAAHVAGIPAGTVVAGFGYRPAGWAVPPTVAALDAVSPDHPVVLTSGDVHAGWLNSRALALLGLAPRVGPVTEREWFDLAPALAARAGDSEAAVRDAVLDAARRGVVGIVDLELGNGPEAWPERFARGIDALRVRTGFYRHALAGAIAAGRRTGAPLAGTRGLVRIGPFKIISDGSLNTRTAHCCEPYADAAALEHPRGVQNHDLAELVDLLRTASDAGFTVALHALGDAAVRTALAAFEATGARGTVEHAQLVRRADLATMARLGIGASVQPAHLLDDRDVTEQCWPDRTDRCFALRSMLAAGVRLTLGSDAPVAPLDPWLALAAAVHRSGDGRPPWHQAEAITLAEALAASTDGRPTLAIGAPGDVVLLDDDPLRHAPDTAALAARLRATAVAATICAGRPTHLAL